MNNQNFEIEEAASAVLAATQYIKDTFSEVDIFEYPHFFCIREIDDYLKPHISKKDRDKILGRIF
jgi:hypothetical protein